jgi:hypothetical protein
MSNKLKFACVAALALASVASPAFAQAATTTAHRHHSMHRPVHSSRANSGYGAYGSIAPAAGPAVNPTDDPTMTGGGSAGYNVCAGHPRC